MEAAGLAVGVVSLYNTLFEVLKCVDAYKSFGTDVALTVDRYDASKLRLEKWAEAVGIGNGQLMDSHDSRLNDPRIASVIKNILRRLTEIFDKAEYTSYFAELPMRQKQAETLDWSTPLDGDREKPQPPSRTSKRRRLIWAVGQKDRFTKDMHNFEGLVSILHDIVPPHEGRARSLTDGMILMYNSL